jgi:hypothetical protein
MEGETGNGRGREKDITSESRQRVARDAPKSPHPDAAKNDKLSCTLCASFLIN